MEADRGAKGGGFCPTLWWTSYDVAGVCFKLKEQELEDGFSKATRWRQHPNIGSLVAPEGFAIAYEIFGGRLKVLSCHGKLLSTETR
ncbi:MAG: hypothetical protein U5K79_17640 [Cyclobacteriaceae bacterium]|nr:hypothetical protein [Cyclobacteriaceae bacterium]